MLKKNFKLITFYSMTDSVLFIFRKRLNFVYLTATLLALLLI